jgi:hypothetical protein
LKTTDDHPFWVVQVNDFKPAVELRPGDDFVGPDGEMQTLVSTRRDDHPNGAPVYNVETQDYHTYFVAAHGSRAPPVLVHNCDVGDLAKERVFWTGGRAAQDAAREFAERTGRETLEMTDEGQRVKQITEGLHPDEAQRFWESASERFAQGTSGDVHVFHTFGATVLSVHRFGRPSIKSSPPTIVSEISFTIFSCQMVLSQYSDREATMEFSTPRPDTVTSSAGFSIKISVPVGILYSESGDEISVDSEVSAGAKGVHVWADSIKIWNKSGAPVDNAERQRILDNIGKALKFMGMDIHITYWDSH